MKFKCRLLVVLLPLVLGACTNLTALLGAVGMTSSNSSSRDTASTRNSPNARSALVKDNATCCIGGGSDCDCDLEKEKQVVYVDKPIEECTRSVRTVKQVDSCPTCSAFPVAVRERGSCASN